MRKPKEDGASKKRSNKAGGGDRSGKLRHGLFRQEPVIPGVENVREFRRFQSGMREALAPRNELQRYMARRISRLAWRLRRVDLYEAAVIARDDQEATEAAAAEAGESATASKQLAWSLDIMRAALKLLKRLPSLSADARVKSSRVLELLGIVADVAGVRLEDVLDLSYVDLESLPRHPLARRWTPSEILEVIAQIAGRTGKEPDGLRLASVVHLMTWSELGEAQAKPTFAIRDQRRALRLLPGDAELDKIVRYETHLSRQLTVMLHEYEALQARDRGGRVPLARLDVQGLD
jgi:hypothetical protein